jgi:hypothetical protein
MSTKHKTAMRRMEGASRAGLGLIGATAGWFEFG